MKKTRHTIILLSACLCICILFAFVACKKSGNNTEQPPTDGLAFTYFTDTASYGVSGIGTATDTDIVIPSAYDDGINGEHAVTNIVSSAFAGCSIQSVIIPDSVTSMGYYAFGDCLQLKSVSTGNGLTSITTATFSGCKNLIEIDIGNSVTSIYSAFSDCGFTDIYIPDNVTYIGHDSFNYCSKLEKVVIGNGNTYIGEHAFCNCESLTDISIGNNVTAIGFLSFTNRYDQYPADNPLGPILDCSKIKYNEYNNAYYLGNSENPYLALISVKSTDITTCEINKNTKIIAGYAFAGCKNLNEIIIPDGVRSIGEGAFSDCGLTSIILPENLTYLDNSAFSGCSDLTNVSVPDSLTYMGDFVFLGCNLKYNEYKNGYYLGNDENPYVVLTAIKDKTVKTFTLHDNTKITDAYVFFNGNFTDIIIPDGLVLIIEPLGGVQPGTGIYPSVRNVFYKGTRDSWNRIVGNNSPCIMYAKIYFYSENRPSVKGDFWHYDESGKTAIW